MLQHLKSNSSHGKQNYGNDKNLCPTEEEIVRYLFRAATDEEKFRVEDHITECDICYDVVTGARNFKNEDELRKHTAALRQDIHKKYPRHAFVIHMPGLIKFSAAALVLIALSGLSYWLTMNPNRQLAAEFIRPYSNAIPLSRSETYKPLLEEAMSEYELENYALAKDKLSLFLGEQPEHWAAHLYCGISALISGEAQEAIPHLQKASNSKELRIAEAAQWYLALANLDLDQTDKAKTILTQLLKQGGYFADSAKLLLERINIE